MDKTNKPALWRSPVSRFWDPFGSFFDRDFPSMDISETDKEMKIEMDIPNYDPKDVNIEVENNVLTVSGEISEEKETEKKKYYRHERYYGSFQRSVALPNYVDVDRIESTSKNGCLTIAIPKKAGAERKKIEVKVK